MPGPDYAGIVTFYEDFPYAWWNDFGRDRRTCRRAPSTRCRADVALTPEYADIADQLERKITGHLRLYGSQMERLFGGTERDGPPGPRPRAGRSRCSAVAAARRSATGRRGRSEPVTADRPAGRLTGAIDGRAGDSVAAGMPWCSRGRILRPRRPDPGGASPDRWPARRPRPVRPLGPRPRDAAVRQRLRPEPLVPAGHGLPLGAPRGARAGIPDGDDGGRSRDPGDHEARRRASPTSAIGGLVACELRARPRWAIVGGSRDPRSTRR